MSKAEIRAEAIKYRETLSASAEDHVALIDNFFTAFPLEDKKIVAVYWPKGREFDVLPLMDEIIHQGHQVALPVVVRSQQHLDFYPYKEGDAMIEGMFGVQEPENRTVSCIPDIIIVPFLAFDRHGYRLGYGKGYYDATLAHYSDAVSAGVGYGEQAMLFNLPREDHDRKLDWIITPQHAIRVA